MRERKIIQKGLKMLLAALTFVMLFGMTSLAADSVTVNMQKEKKGIYSSYGNYSNYTDVYNKIVVKNTSTLVVSGYCIYPYSNTHGSLRITLLNKNRREIADGASYVNADSEKGGYAVYAVKAGTYYIKVDSEKMFALAAEIKKVTDKGGSTRKKAAVITKGKTVKGLLCTGEKASRADWYRFSVTKSGILELTISANTNGYFEFYIYGPSYPNGNRLSSLKNEKGVYYSIQQSTREKAKVKTGTYYIKVNRVSYTPKASGVYSIKWKLK